MLKPNNTTDASQLPCRLAVVGDDNWGLDDSWGWWFGVIGGPSGATPCPPSGLWQDPSRCAEKICLDKEVHLFCFSFTASKEKRLMAKWHSFLSWIRNFCNQAGLLPSVQTWRWRLLRMHLLPFVLLLLHSKFPNLTTFMASCDSAYIINAWWWVIALSNWDRDAWFKYPWRIWHLIKLKNWCFWTVVLEKTLESPLDYNEIQPVTSKGDQSWVFIGRTDAKAETPVLWPPHAKSWLIGKDSDAGRDWGQKEKGMTEDEMAGWYHRLDGHEFE